MSTRFGGSCLCGAVAFDVAAPYRWFAHCHCSMCRKHHGSLFGTSFGVASEAFRWLEGVDAIVHYRATPAFERPFCGRCGSTVPALSHDPRYWNVPAGLLAADPGARPRSHIFVASRSPLVELDDVLPRHDAYPPRIVLPTAADAPRDLRSRAPARPSLDVEPGLAGSCLCGAVAFTATVLPRRVVNCHCSLCRRSRAAAFGSTLPVPRETFRWDRGEARVRSFALPLPGRYGTDFCADCGSLVPSAPTGAETAMVPAGAIDSPLPRLPAVHLCVGSKAPWYEIAGASPQFAALPPPEQLNELHR